MRTEFNRELIKKYDRPGPRYTSYPPATEFTEEVGAQDYRERLIKSNERKTPLSLYFHIPFCESGCYYCGCNIIISHRKGIERPYLDRVYREMDMVSELLDRERRVEQLHWGGGTPNYLEPDEIREFMGEIKRRFTFSEDAEVSIEIDPRYATDEQLQTIRDVGFNRVSMGLQDLDEKVQRAINRIQPYELMERTMKRLRELGFYSINIDLIYGLPYQTRESFQRTVEKVIELDPNRIAVYSFAYVPWVKPIQKHIDPDTLPSAEEKLSIIEMVIEKFQDAGYVYIGMDHFAKPEDELAVAQREGKLWRNFQGYTTRKGVELLGIGATSIGMLQDSYFQNYKTLREYNVAIDEGRLPVFRGYILNDDDFIRREVIMDIMCNLGVSFSRIEEEFGINFEDYFERELEELRELEEDGLIELKDRRINILPVGRLLIRNVAMVFDAYLKSKKELKFSRTI
ncbi:oxygen-independent coproporphyrinogen III oxidase [Hydrogenivirga sp. 128-5-R1-1]|uniref:oxygen-independent coproporphyrinogen III oxidase n=1 Tax=Hydrogenivirga sp. 128-5-R1-1 TaxID=392423 RepID=UPI00015F0C3E|nr:oxygen-independent coproporphyrinogen III oxidase [Hydrogenivirga sp. 128-5-R1-1]EDP75837.1 coproporphyrinogen III oxidase [Hydrogenivirga sp. 128-5-R1-1]